LQQLPDAVNRNSGAGLSADGLCRRFRALGLSWGQEDSFKLLKPSRLLAHRFLAGVPLDVVDSRVLLSLGDELGIPAVAREALAARLAAANAVFYGIEDRPQGPVFKMYLEFWDEARRLVRSSGGRAPVVLHWGVKWSADRPGHFEQAQYLCHPLLSTRDALRRIAALYVGTAITGSGDSAQAIVRQAWKAAPEAALLYVEVEEDGNPRRSFDINLYPAALRVSDIAPALRDVANRFDIAADRFEPHLQRLAALPLGHLSGGLDRHGDEFLSVYAEVQPMPVRG
jgi:tryptophan halogenase